MTLHVLSIKRKKISQVQLSSNKPYLGTKYCTCLKLKVSNKLEINLGLKFF